MKTLLYYMTLGIASLAFSTENNIKILSIHELAQTDFFQELVKVPKEDQEKYILSKWDSQVVAFFEKGTILPLKQSLSGYFRLINEDTSNLQIKLENDLYVKMERGNFLFSDDARTWKEATQLFTGDISFGLEIDSNTLEKVPKLTFEGTFNKR